MTTRLITEATYQRLKMIEDAARYYVCVWEEADTDEWSPELGSALSELKGSLEGGRA